MYLDNLKSATEKLYVVANNPDIEPAHLGPVLFEVCQILQRLPEQKEFLRDLRRLEELQKEHIEEYQKIIGSYSSFTEFFIHEQGLLLTYNLNRDLVLALGAEAEALYGNISNIEITAEEIISSIECLAKYICDSSKKILNSADVEIVTEKGLQGLMGVSIVGVNLKALPFEIGLPGGALLASTGSGVFLLKNAISKNHMFGRIRKFFRRRDP